MHAIPRKQKQMRREVEARRQGQQRMSEFFEANAAFFPSMNLKSNKTNATAETNLNDALHNIKCKACRYNAKNFPKKCHKNQWNGLLDPVTNFSATCSGQATALS